MCNLPPAPPGWNDKPRTVAPLGEREVTPRGSVRELNASSNSIHVPKILLKSKSNFGRESARPSHTQSPHNPNNVSTISLNSNGDETSAREKVSLSPMAPGLSCPKMNRTYSCIPETISNREDGGDTQRQLCNNTSFTNKTYWANERKRYKEESASVRKVSQDCGAEMYKTMKTRKDLSKQIEAVENRIKRLQKEDTDMKEKIEKTKKKGDEIMKTKIRHKQEIENKENLKQIRAKKNELEKKLNRDLQKQRKDDLATAIIKRLQEKKNAAEAVKMLVKNEKDRQKQKKAEDDVVFSQKKAEIVQVESKLRSKGLNGDITLRNDLSKQYTQKMDDEKRYTEALQKKLKDLEGVEIGLLEQLKHTFDTHQFEYQRVEQLYRTNAKDASISL